MRSARRSRNPARPLVAIVAGSKVSTKLTILDALAKKVDSLIVGGGIANTFLLAAGKPIGKSLAEPDLVGEAKKIARARRKVPLPDRRGRAPSRWRRASGTIKAVDAGRGRRDDPRHRPETAAGARRGARRARAPSSGTGRSACSRTTPFAKGTEALAQRHRRVEGVLHRGRRRHASPRSTSSASPSEIDYISTAGGAFLEFLEGKTLPAVAALEARADG